MTSFDYTPDEAKSYARGYAKAQKNHELANRVAAFGAIRRAAEEARKNDCHCGGCPISHRAKLIRRAIRAPIGSKKAY